MPSGTVVCGNGVLGFNPSVHGTGAGGGGGLPACWARKTREENTADSKVRTKSRRNICRSSRTSPTYTVAICQVHRKKSVAHYNGSIVQGEKEGALILIAAKPSSILTFALKI